MLGRYETIFCLGLTVRDRVSISFKVSLLAVYFMHVYSVDAAIELGSWCFFPVPHEVPNSTLAENTVPFSQLGIAIPELIF